MLEFVGIWAIFVGFVWLAGRIIGWREQSTHLADHRANGTTCDGTCSSVVNRNMFGPGDGR